MNVAILGRLMATVRGSEYVAGGVQEWLDSCANMDEGDEGRCGRYTLYEDFYDGDRGAMLRNRAREYLQRFGIPFCENFCEPVVDVVAERLEVIGFQSSIATDDSDPVGELVEGWWQDARLDSEQGVVYTQSLIKGDEYAIVEWDATLGRPAISRQLQHQVKVVYSDDRPGVIEYGCKVWNTQTKSKLNPAGRRIQRLNIYFPDHVEKWFRPHTGSDGKGGWERWQDDGDTGWPVWWTDTGTREGEPLGVAVVAFPNKPLGAGKGRSRVKAAIPFQEQLNKYVADLNDLIDNHALPQDWVTGVAGETVIERVPGDVWKATGENVKFGRLDGTPTSNLLDAIEGLISRLARRSRVPMHLLTGGTPPSGEALKTSESGLIAVVEDAQKVYGNAWEDAMLLGCRLAAAFGSDTVKQTLASAQPQPDGEGAGRGELRLTAQWRNPETRSDQGDLQVAEAKQRLGVSKHTLLGELGYDAEKEAELRQGEQEADAAVLGKVFDQGGLPGQ